jgi:uncharacterized membrane protein
MSVVTERAGPPAVEDTTTGAKSVLVGGKPRVVGVDVARGVALVGMMATHVFDIAHETGAPSAVHMVASGRAVATFVLIAGVSLAFLSGGRTAVRARKRTTAAAGLAVRAVLIGALGLSLGLLSPLNGVLGILPFYGLLFLLAIPLLGLNPRVLVGIAAAAIALGPVLLVATANAGLPKYELDPTPATLMHDPLGLLVQLSLTGEFPVVVYLAYLCVGLAIGRLDLSSRRVAWWLLGGGVVLAVAARAASALLLYPMGGLARLVEQSGLQDDPAGAAQTLLWEPERSSSWWYLALPAPHSHTPLDLLHTLGSAAAVLGAALLLTRVPALRRVLSPLAAAGSMALTLYSAHLVLLATGVLDDDPVLLYLVMVAGALGLAAAWRRWFTQGPLEKLVSVPATSTRRAVAGLFAEHRSTSMPSSRSGPRYRDVARAGSLVLGALASVGVLALAFSVVAPAAALAEEEDAAVPVAAAERELPGPALPVGPAGAPQSLPAPALVADLTRYCALSDQLNALSEAHPDQPGVVVEKGTVQLNEMPQVAPAEIRDAITTIAADARAEAGAVGVTAPDDATLERAEATVETPAPLRATGPRPTQDSARRS